MLRYRSQKDGSVTGVTFRSGVGKTKAGTAGASPYCRGVKIIAATCVTCSREPCPKARYPTHGPKNKPKKTGDMRYVFMGFAYKSANPAPWDRRGSKKTPPRSVQAYGNRPKAIPDAWGKRRGHGNATWGVRQRSSKSRSSLPGDGRG